MTPQVYNFYAGPATLPRAALEIAQKELLNYKNTGISIMEMSHRSKDYDEIHETATSLIQELMGLSDEYKILWLQGGASSEFYMVPINLRLENKPMEFSNTGVWSKKAIKEAKFYGDVKIVASSEDKGFSYIPKNIIFNSGTSFAHITGNNTIYGTEYHTWPKVPDDVPLVCDMSSNIMDKEIDTSKFGVIYAGAQKNIGPAGITIVIVREDLLQRVPEETPTMQKWRTHAEKKSLFNTPSTWSIYICKLCLENLKKNGGVSGVEKRNRQKAKLLYDTLDNSNGFYKPYVDKDSRSLMNVTFNLETTELEQKCVQEGVQHGLLGLKGHRSVGGMRASIYNAMTLDGVQALVDFLKEFQEDNQ